MYENGESPEHATMIWGENMTDLLDQASIKLGMWRKAKIFYTEEGKKVSNNDFLFSLLLLIHLQEIVEGLVFHCSLSLCECVCVCVSVSV